MIKERESDEALGCEWRGSSHPHRQVEFLSTALATSPDTQTSVEAQRGLFVKGVGVKKALEGSLSVYALMAPGTEGKMDQKTRFLNDDVSEMIMFCRRNNPVILQGWKQEGGQRSRVGGRGGRGFKQQEVTHPTIFVKQARRRLVDLSSSISKQQEKTDVDLCETSEERCQFPWKRL